MVHGSCQEALSCLALTDKVSVLWELSSVSNGLSTLNPQAVVLYITLITNHVWKALAMSKKLRKSFHNFLRQPLFFLERMIHRVLCRKGKPTSLQYRISVGVYIFMLATFDFFSSFAFYLWLVIVNLGWGTLQLFMPRIQVVPACVKHHLDKWTFGQILPLVLLLAPFYSLAEKLSGKQR